MCVHVHKLHFIPNHPEPMSSWRVFYEFIITSVFPGTLGGTEVLFISHIEGPQTVFSDYLSE